MGASLSIWICLAALFEAKPAATTPLDPACVSRAAGDLCDMPDGTGGTCQVARCGAPGGEQPCLRCARAPANTNDESSAQTVLLIVGGLLSLGGLVFVWRLRKHWGP